MVDKKLDLFWVLISSCLSCLLPVLGDERSQERFELELQVEGFEEQVEKEIKSNKWDDSLVLPFEKDCLRKLDELLLVTTSYLQSLEPPMPDMKKNWKSNSSYISFAGDVLNLATLILERKTAEVSTPLFLHGMDEGRRQLLRNKVDRNKDGGYDYKAIVGIEVLLLDRKFEALLLQLKGQLKNGFVSSVSKPEFQKVIMRLEKLSQDSQKHLSPWNIFDLKLQVRAVK